MVVQGYFYYDNDLCGGSELKMSPINLFSNGVNRLTKTRGKQKPFSRTEKNHQCGHPKTRN